MILQSDAAGLRGYPGWGATAASLGRKANSNCNGSAPICKTEGRTGRVRKLSNKSRRRNDSVRFVRKSAFGTLGIDSSRHIKVVAAGNDIGVGVARARHGVKPGVRSAADGRTLNMVTDNGASAGGRRQLEGRLRRWRRGGSRPRG